MRKEMRWRYYCDFCRKGGGSGGAMARHEKSCTANPTRECRMCKADEIEQEPLDALVAAAREGLDALRAKANGCAACMLAAVRRLPFDERPLQFDFKTESRRFWDEVNTRRERQEAQGGY